MREYDRVAPKGTGRWKVGGNYAASLQAGMKAHELGYSAVLYLDPKEKKYLDECGPANFFAIKTANTSPPHPTPSSLHHQQESHDPCPRHGHGSRAAPHSP